MPSQGIELLFPNYIDLATAYQAPAFAPSNPAGLQFTHTVGPDAFEVLISLMFTFSTSAAVATRYVRLNLITPDGNLVTQVVADTVQPASQLFVYYFLIQGTTAYQAGTSGNYVHPLWWLVMPSGYRWTITVDSMQAGDQLTQINAAQQFFPTGTRLASGVGGPELLPTLAGQIGAVQDGSPAPTPAPAPAPTLSDGTPLEPVAPTAPPVAPTFPSPANSPPLGPSITPITQIPQPPPGGPAPTPSPISIPIVGVPVPEPLPSPGGGLYQKSE